MVFEPAVPRRPTGLASLPKSATPFDVVMVEVLKTSASAELI